MEKTERHHEDLRTLAGKLLTVQDEERRRISRDLHDDVNQRLGAIGLQLDSLCQHLPVSSCSFAAGFARFAATSANSRTMSVSWPTGSTKQRWKISGWSWHSSATLTSSSNARASKPNLSNRLRHAHPRLICHLPVSDCAGELRECRTACQGVAGDRRVFSVAGSHVSHNSGQRNRHGPRRGPKPQAGTRHAQHAGTGTSAERIGGVAFDSGRGTEVVARLPWPMEQS